jgi:L-alanine-DL-glutamate epimerase-like enolase superfamily enzyme
VRIVDMSVFVHHRQWGITTGFGTVPDDLMPMGVLTIHTDEGITGHAFVSGPGPGAMRPCGDLVTSLKPLLVGRDPLDIGALWGELWPLTEHATKPIDPIAVGAVDVALWDIAGKVAQLPVHRLLGTCKDNMPAYISSWVHRVPHQYADEATFYAEQGWVGYKPHPPTQWRKRAEQVSIDVDIETCRQVRAAAGDAMILMLDSACAYDLAEALAVGKEIEELGFHWFEDPLGCEEIDAYVELLDQLDIMVVATEITSGGFAAMAPWITRRATNALRGDVMLKGGITGMMKIAHLAEAFGFPCEIHDGFNSLGNVGCLHVAMAVPNCSMFEVLTINPSGVYGLDHLSYGLTEPIAFDDAHHVLAPTKPGLGYEIDWELIYSRGQQLT